MPVLLHPTCAALKQKARERGVAAKHRMVQGRRIPVASAYGDRPAQLHHEPDGVVAPERGKLRQQAKLLLGQRAGKVGSFGLNALASTTEL